MHNLVAVGSSSSRFGIDLNSREKGDLVKCFSIYDSKGEKLWTENIVWLLIILQNELSEIAPFYLVIYYKQKNEFISSLDKLREANKL